MNVADPFLLPRTPSPLSISGVTFDIGVDTLSLLIGPPLSYHVQTLGRWVVRIALRFDLNLTPERRRIGIPPFPNETVQNWYDAKYPMLLTPHLFPFMLI